MSTSHDNSSNCNDLGPYEDDNASEKYDVSEPIYKSFRPSDKRQSLSQPRRPLRSRSKWLRQNGRSIASITIALLLITLSIAQLCFLLRSRIGDRPRRSAESSASRQAARVRTISCGDTVAKAKARDCTWDELSKAWLPRACPRYGFDEYRMQGLLANPHQNASSWPYYWDQQGTSGLNLDHVAADEARDMTEKVWTTSRQHLVHCAATPKRTIWSYENGHGHYDAVSRLDHAHHCIDTLLRGAIRAEGESVDHITTLTRVHVGYCTFVEWD